MSQDFKTFNSDNVMIFLFRSSLQLSLAFGRVHEDYEGGKLKGPLKGINFPFEFYKDWISSHKESLNSLEKQVYDLIKDCKYIIASLIGDQSSLYHEWAHAYYFLNPKFQIFVQEMFDDLPAQIKKVILNDLKMKGYSSNVFLDEFQAYVLENPNEFGKKCSNTLTLLHQKLREIIQRPVLQIINN